MAAAIVFGGGKNPVVMVLQHQTTDRAVTRPASSEPEGQILQGEALQDEVPRGQVLAFRPLGQARNHPIARNAPRSPAVPDLEKYERAANEPDDFRHRMIMNGLGLAVTVALVVGGIWIADVMAHMRKDQDCVLTGRPGCTHVDVPLQPR